MAATLDKIQNVKSDFPILIRRALKYMLRRDQYARLKDAGSVSETQIRTGQVFVDLPVTERFESIAEPNKLIRQSFPLIVSLIAKIAKSKFDDDDSDKSYSVRHYLNENLPLYANRIVVLGGPGQGKSTISAFTAQIFRAALLNDDARSKQDPTTNSIVAEIQTRASQQDIPDSLPRRYPVLISLPKFADVVSAARSENRPLPSILAQIVADLSQAADNEISRADARLWLASYPWLVLLDGLDEVPSSGDRGAILAALEDFESEISDLNADVLMIATTRPQGYNQDLDPERWYHFHLAELTVEKALEYADALGQARYPEDPDRRNEILHALRRASVRAATSRLLTNPLQVTIMQLIVGNYPPPCAPLISLIPSWDGSERS